jgi:hypothetical protein
MGHAHFSVRMNFINQIKKIPSNVGYNYRLAIAHLALGEFPSIIGARANQTTVS